jgi:hypothetical protein
LFVDLLPLTPGAEWTAGKEGGREGGEEVNVWGGFRTVGIALCSLAHFLLHLALNGLQVRKEGGRGRREEERK